MTIPDSSDRKLVSPEAHAAYEVFLKHSESPDCPGGCFWGHEAEDDDQIPCAKGLAGTGGASSVVA